MKDLTSERRLKKMTNCQVSGEFVPQIQRTEKSD